MGAALTKVTRARRKTAVRANIEGIDMVEIIKMTGQKKAPGLRMNDW